MSQTFHFNLSVSDAETNEDLFEIQTNSFYRLQLEIIKQYFSGNNCKIENRLTDSYFSINH